MPLQIIVYQMAFNQHVLQYVSLISNYQQSMIKYISSLSLSQKQFIAHATPDFWFVSVISIRVRFYVSTRTQPLALYNKHRTD